MFLLLCGQFWEVQDGVVWALRSFAVCPFRSTGTGSYCTSRTRTSAHHTLVCGWTCYTIPPLLHALTPLHHTRLHSHYLHTFTRHTYIPLPRVLLPPVSSPTDPTLRSRLHTHTLLPHTRINRTHVPSLRAAVLPPAHISADVALNRFACLH